MRRVSLLKKVLGQFGVDPRRVRLEFISASEGARYAEVVDEFADEIRTLGPLSLEHPGDVKSPAHAEEVVNV
jgi:F420-non-reducing hydrogenase iron-sulfur subunit